MSTANPTIPVPSVCPNLAGWWISDGQPPLVGVQSFEQAIQRLATPVYVVDAEGQLAVAQGGAIAIGADPSTLGPGYPLLGYAPVLRPEQFGDAQFRADHGLRFAYVAGAMANGIASEEIVEAMGKAGMIGFFGAAGLAPDRVAAAIDRLQGNLGDLPFGCNLIHTPSEPQLENAIVDLYLQRGVRRISAAAYLDLTEPLVRYRVAGIFRDGQGRVITPNHVFAKVSRVEVATKFFSPPPESMLRSLVSKGAITAEQAQLAAMIPVAQDLTAEADSGGHTDNRPALALLPTMLALRDQLQARFGYAGPLRVGAAGGIATPQSVAAAYSMGAAYVLTGTINQACVESGSSDIVRQMLAEASQADVVMAPAADMFEMGVKVQVLKRGTMFAMRAQKLYELYRAYGSLDEIPAPQRAELERSYFRESIEQVWEGTKAYFAQRDPQQVERAEKDAKHKMALVFRAYLGKTSRWANAGEPSRRVDYQVWCGPAMGAFNEWVRGTFLEQPQHRDVVTVALNLLVGAAALTRSGWLRTQGVPLPPSAGQFAARPPGELAALLQ